MVNLDKKKFVKKVRKLIVCIWYVHLHVLVHVGLVDLSRLVHVYTCVTQPNLRFASVAEMVRVSYYSTQSGGGTCTCRNYAQGSLCEDCLG